MPYDDKGHTKPIDEPHIPANEEEKHLNSQLKK
jgi:hypothetical protein